MQSKRTAYHSDGTGHFHLRQASKQSMCPPAGGTLLGFWMQRAQWLRQGIAELLLIAVTERAAEIGARVMTLEVRVSNTSAQALYRKYGFEVVGRRPQYYSDNREDALIMTTPPITSAEYQRVFQERKAVLLTRLSR